MEARNSNFLDQILFLIANIGTAANILLTTWMSFTINDTPISQENWTQILISQQIVFLELFSWPLFKSWAASAEFSQSLIWKKKNKSENTFLFVNVNQFHIIFFKRKSNNFTNFFFIRLSIAVAALAAAAGGVN